MKPRFLALAALAVCFATWPGWAGEPRGGQFLAFTNLSRFGRSAGDRPGETVLTSPPIPALLDWDQLIASWNLAPGTGTWLKVEVRAIYPDRATKFYTMGLDAADRKAHPRESVRGQKDADGDVSTDTLLLRSACRTAQVRLTLGGLGVGESGVKFLSLCLSDSKAAPEALPPNRTVWGTELRVMERSQMAYPNGNVLCSPTTVSMLMTFWAGRLHRSELDHDVPFLVEQIYDPVWEGTGNWALNMAYAGSYPGMRGCVSRFSDPSELEDWIARGIPVGLSVDIQRLAGRENRPREGHLVVCIGFTKEGDVVLNDPGRSREVHRIVPRQNLLNAWAASRNTVYLVYPEGAALPEDRFGHWSPGF